MLGLPRPGIATLAGIRLAYPREDPYCPCDNLTPQAGHHLTFKCPLHTRERTQLLGDKQTWEEIDTSFMIKVDVNQYEDGVQQFFAHLFDQLT